MHFFEGLSKEAQALISVLGQPKPLTPVYHLSVDVRHVVMGHLCTEQIQLPYEYPNYTNVALMCNEFKGLSNEDILWVLKDSNLVMGKIDSFDVSIVRC